MPRKRRTITAATRAAISRGLARVKGKTAGLDPYEANPREKKRRGTNTKGLKNVAKNIDKQAAKAKAPGKEHNPYLAGKNSGLAKTVTNANHSTTGIDKKTGRKITVSKAADYGKGKATKTPKTNKPTTREMYPHVPKQVTGGGHQASPEYLNKDAIKGEKNFQKDLAAQYTKLNNNPQAQQAFLQRIFADHIAASQDTGDPQTNRLNLRKALYRQTIAEQLGMLTPEGQQTGQKPTMPRENVHDGKPIHDPTNYVETPRGDTIHKAKAAEIKYGDNSPTAKKVKEQTGDPGSTTVDPRDRGLDTTPPNATPPTKRGTQPQRRHTEQAPEPQEQPTQHPQGTAHTNTEPQTPPEPTTNTPTPQERYNNARNNLATANNQELTTLAQQNTPEGQAARDTLNDRAQATHRDNALREALANSDNDELATIAQGNSTAAVTARQLLAERTSESNPFAPTSDGMTEREATRRRNIRGVDNDIADRDREQFGTVINNINNDELAKLETQDGAQQLIATHLPEGTQFTPEQAHKQITDYLDTHSPLRDNGTFDKRAGDMGAGALHNYVRRTQSDQISDKDLYDYAAARGNKHALAHTSHADNYDTFLDAIGHGNNNPRRVDWNTVTPKMLRDAAQWQQGDTATNDRLRSTYADNEGNMPALFDDYNTIMGDVWEKIGFIPTRDNFVRNEMGLPTVGPRSESDLNDHLAKISARNARNASGTHAPRGTAGERKRQAAQRKAEANAAGKDDKRLLADLKKFEAGTMGGSNPTARDRKHEAHKHEAMRRGLIPQDDSYKAKTKAVKKRNATETPAKAKTRNDGRKPVQKQDSTAGNNGLREPANAHERELVDIANMPVPRGDKEGHKERRAAIKELQAKGIRTGAAELDKPQATTKTKKPKASTTKAEKPQDTEKTAPRLPKLRTDNRTEAQRQEDLNRALDYDRPERAKNTVGAVRDELQAKLDQLKAAEADRKRRASLPDINEDTRDSEARTFAEQRAEIKEFAAHLKDKADARKSISADERKQLDTLRAELAQSLKEAQEKPRRNLPDINEDTRTPEQQTHDAERAKMREYVGHVKDRVASRKSISDNERAELEALHKELQDRLNKPDTTKTTKADKAKPKTVKKPATQPTKANGGGLTGELAKLNATQGPAVFDAMKRLNELEAAAKTDKDRADIRSVKERLDVVQSRESNRKNIAKNVIESLVNPDTGNPLRKRDVSVYSDDDLQAAIDYPRWYGNDHDTPVGEKIRTNVTRLARAELDRRKAANNTGVTNKSRSQATPKAATKAPKPTKTEDTATKYPSLDGNKALLEQVKDLDDRDLAGLYKANKAAERKWEKVKKGATGLERSNAANERNRAAQNAMALGEELRARGYKLNRLNDLPEGNSRTRGTKRTAPEATTPAPKPASKPAAKATTKPADTPNATPTKPGRHSLADTARTIMVSTTKDRDMLPELQLAQVEKRDGRLYIRTSDRYRLNEVALDADGNDFSHSHIVGNINAKALGEALKELNKEKGTLKVSHDGEKLTLERGGKTIDLPEDSKNAPAFQKVMRPVKDAGDTMTVNRKQLQAALNAVKPDSRPRNGDNVRLHVDNDGLHVTYITKTGEAKDTVIPVKGNTNFSDTGHSVDIAFNAKYLKDMIRTARGDELNLQTEAPHRPMQFTDGNHTSLLMPVRIMHAVDNDKLERVDMPEVGKKPGTAKAAEKAEKPNVTPAKPQAPKDNGTPKLDGQNGLKAPAESPLKLNHWEKNGRSRTYVNDWHELVGLEVHHYNTGNVSYAELNGKKIANRRAAALLGTKVWVDNNTNELHIDMPRSAQGATELTPEVMRDKLTPHIAKEMDVELTAPTPKTNQNRASGNAKRGTLQPEFGEWTPTSGETAGKKRYYLNNADALLENHTGDELDNVFKRAAQLSRVWVDEDGDVHVKEKRRWGIEDDLGSDSYQTAGGRELYTQRVASEIREILDKTGTNPVTGGAKKNAGGKTATKIDPYTGEKETPLREPQTAQEKALVQKLENTSSMAERRELRRELAKRGVSPLTTAERERHAKISAARAAYKPTAAEKKPGNDGLYFNDKGAWSTQRALNNNLPENGATERRDLMAHIDGQDVHITELHRQHNGRVVMRGTNADGTPFTAKTDEYGKLNGEKVQVRVRFSAGHLVDTPQQYHAKEKLDSVYESPHSTNAREGNRDNFISQVKHEIATRKIDSTPDSDTVPTISDKEAIDYALQSVNNRLNGGRDKPLPVVIKGASNMTTHMANKRNAVVIDNGIPLHNDEMRVTEDADTLDKARAELIGTGAKVYMADNGGTLITPTDVKQYGYGLKITGVDDNGKKHTIKWGNTNYSNGHKYWKPLTHNDGTPYTPEQGKQWSDLQAQREAALNARGSAVDRLYNSVRTAETTEALDALHKQTGAKTQTQPLNGQNGLKANQTSSEKKSLPKLAKTVTPANGRTGLLYEDFNKTAEENGVQFSQNHVLRAVEEHAEGLSDLDLKRAYESARNEVNSKGDAIGGAQVRNAYAREARKRGVPLSTDKPYDRGAQPQAGAGKKAETPDAKAKKIEADAKRNSEEKEARKAEAERDANEAAKKLAKQRYDQFKLREKREAAPVTVGGKTYEPATHGNYYNAAQQLADDAKAHDFYVETPEGELLKPDTVKKFKNGGIKFTGLSPEGKKVTFRTNDIGLQTITIRREQGTPEFTTDDMGRPTGRAAAPLNLGGTFGLATRRDKPGKSPSDKENKGGDTPKAKGGNGGNNPPPKPPRGNSAMATPDEPERDNGEGKYTKKLEADLQAEQRKTPAKRLKTARTALGQDSGGRAPHEAVNNFQDMRHAYIALNAMHSNGGYEQNTARDYVDQFIASVEDHFTRMDSELNRPTELPELHTKDYDGHVAFQSEEMENYALEKARELLAAAKGNFEPLALQIANIIHDTGAIAVGLEHRLKTENSMVDKIYRDTVDKAGANFTKKNVDDAVKEMTDTFRFTAMFKTGEVFNGVKSLVEAMGTHGYRLTGKNDTADKLTSSFGRGGANSKYVLTVGKDSTARFENGLGNVVEIQIHSPASYAVKELTHPGYDAVREHESDSPKYRELDKGQSWIIDRATEER